jgi:hypothetical protein
VLACVPTGSAKWVTADSRAAFPSPTPITCAPHSTSSLGFPATRSGGVEPAPRAGDDLLTFTHFTRSQEKGSLPNPLERLYKASERRADVENIAPPGPDCARLTGAAVVEAHDVCRSHAIGGLAPPAMTGAIVNPALINAQRTAFTAQRHVTYSFAMDDSPGGEL